MNTIKLHGIELTDNAEIAPGLFIAKSKGIGWSDVPMYRTHNGSIFLGYTRNDCKSQKTGKSFGIDVWSDVNHLYRVNRRMGWKTLAGARRALIANTIKLNSLAPSAK